MPEALRAELAPLGAVLAPLEREIAAADERPAILAAADPVIRRLMTTPGVGPVTRAAFVAALADVTRFATAHHVEASRGLVPREWSSGEQQRRLVGILYVLGTTAPTTAPGARGALRHSAPRRSPPIGCR